MNHFGLIMAGGGGTRFWPLSRQKTPKQLLNLSGKDYMVNEAIDRLANVIGKSNIFIITSELQASSMINVTEGRVYQRNILAEPAARNTTACIGYAAMYILKKYGDGVMIITPSDHYIEDVDALSEVFRLALTIAEETDKMITIGLTPTYPATGYGYIKAEGKDQIRKVLEFKEKPKEATAKEYIEAGSYYWNSGMFIWKVSLILEKIKANAPDIYESLEKMGTAMNTPMEQDVLHDCYPNIRNISIDYAVMEPSAANGDVLMIPCDCGWNDVGSWDMMNILHDQDNDNNVLLGDVVAVDVKNSTVYAGSRMVAAVDVENIVIVETSDVVMVCRKDRAQNVKKIVETLNNTGRKELL